MFSTIFTKTLYTLRWQLLGWTIGIFFVTFITLAFFNSFNQNGIDAIVGSMPDSVKSIIGDVSVFKSLTGYIGQEVFGPNVVILTIAMAIIVCIGVSASEEDSRRMQSLLSLPVTRTSVYFQKWLTVLFLIAIVIAGIVAGIYTALPIIDKSVGFGHVLQSALECWLMNTAYGTIAYSVAMATGRKGLTIALASGYTALSFIISSLAPSVDKLDFVDRFSVFHYYNHPLTMQHGLDSQHISVLIVVIVILTFLGWLGFIRRDITT